MVGAVSDDEGGGDGGGGMVLTLLFPLILLWLLQAVVSYRSRPWGAGVLGRVCALLTVVVLLVFLIYGLKEDTSGDGLGHIFGVAVEDLDHPDIWLDAFGQVHFYIHCFLILISNIMTKMIITTTIS